LSGLKVKVAFTRSNWSICMAEFSWTHPLSFARHPVTESVDIVKLVVYLGDCFLLLQDWMTLCQCHNTDPEKNVKPCNIQITFFLYDPN